MPRRLLLIRAVFVSRTSRVLIASVAIAAAANCAVGVDPNAETGPEVDATVSDVTHNDMGPLVDTPPAVDAFACTGTTCTVAHGTGACVSGRCQVGACEMGYSDLDHNAMNGCECMTGMVSSNCGTPTDLGMMAVGGTRPVTGVLATMTAEHWVRVNFAPGGHPHIQFMTNPGMAYRFAVATSCMPTATLHCPDRAEGATGLTNWEYFDNPNDSGMPNDPDAAMTPPPTSVLIHITTTMPTTMCTPYTLTVTN